MRDKNDCTAFDEIALQTLSYDVLCGMRVDCRENVIEVDRLCARVDTSSQVDSSLLAAALFVSNITQDYIPDSHLDLPLRSDRHLPTSLDR